MGSVFCIVDMVNDFIRPEGKLYFSKGEAVVSPIVRLKAAFRAAGVPVLYDNDAHPEQAKEFETWPPHCLMGSWGARLVDPLAAGAGDIIFHKDALSLFYDGTAEKLLRGLDASRLYVAGVATEYCVRDCVLDARARGFAVTVIEDAVAGVDLTAGDCQKALTAMGQAGATFASTAAVLAEIG